MLANAGGTGGNSRYLISWAPATPTAAVPLTVLSSGTSNTLSWTAPPSSGADVDYVVSATSSTFGTPIASRTVSGTTAEFDDLAPGTHTFSVTPRNPVGVWPTSTVDPCRWSW